MKVTIPLVSVSLALGAQSIHGFVVGVSRPVGHGRHVRSMHAASRSRALPLGAAPGLTMAAEGESFLSKFKGGWGASISAPAVGEHGASPLGIHTKSKPVQALAVAAIAAAYIAGVKGVLKLLVELESKCNVFGTWKATWAPVLGAFYALQGVLHFSMMKDMCNIVPAKGAWGLWYIPGRASFHVKWTGIVEFLAGGALLAGWLDMGPVGLLEKAAAVLFGLTVAVTPATIFCFTHGAEFPLGKKYPAVAHVARFALQCLFLSICWKLAAF